MTYSIQQAIDVIRQQLPAELPDDTVDVFKTGDPRQELRGIVTSFMPTVGVIRQAEKLGANLVIVHEPLFYNHTDAVDWLTGDPVYQAKRKLLDETGVVVWRFHDGWHSVEPDGVLEGLLRNLGWQQNRDAHHPLLIHLQPTTLADLALMLKARLGLQAVRTVGPADLVCRNAVITVGFAPGEAQIQILNETSADVVIGGETFEWITIEYMRDAQLSGMPKGVIILGHANSEEPGMAYLAEWLRPLLPGVAISHVPAGDPFTFR